jgi:hypothetical protein
LFWKSQKTQATTEGKQNKGESKFEWRKGKNHVLLKLSSSRLVNSFRNSTMLESNERLFPVCICWRRRKKSEVSLKGRKKMKELWKKNTNMKDQGVSRMDILQALQQSPWFLLF